MWFVADSHAVQVNATNWRTVKIKSSRILSKLTCWKLREWGFKKDQKCVNYFRLKGVSHKTFQNSLTKTIFKTFRRTNRKLVEQEQVKKDITDSKKLNLPLKLTLGSFAFFVKVHKKVIFSSALSIALMSTNVHESPVSRKMACQENSTNKPYIILAYLVWTS